MSVPHNSPLKLHINGETGGYGYGLCNTTHSGGYQIVRELNS